MHWCDTNCVMYFMVYFYGHVHGLLLWYTSGNKENLKLSAVYKVFLCSSIFLWLLRVMVSSVTNGRKMSHHSQTRDSNRGWGCERMLCMRCMFCLKYNKGQRQWPRIIWRSVWISADWEEHWLILFFPASQLFYSLTLSVLSLRFQAGILYCKADISRKEITVLCK